MEFLRGTYAKDRGFGTSRGSPLSRAVKVGWILCFAGAVAWLFGENATGSPSLIDWYGNAPWWIAWLLPNMESEMGMAALSIGALLIYWPARR
jgi:hypothetical protein